MRLKDEVLNDLEANGHNVAQFVSFSPGLGIRYCHLNYGGVSVDTLDQLVAIVLEASNARSVNIRSFHPDSMQGNEFIYGVTDVETAVSHVERLAAEGLYTIVHETIDVNDGGVSGVVQNGFIEFSPGVTPRGVENSKEPICSFDDEVGIRILERVYSVDLNNLRDTTGKRTEFSIHPKPVGVKRERVITWEVHAVPYTLKFQPRYVWPNAFSKMIGDKVFGLLLASELGFPIPGTHVTLRNKPVEFGFGGSPGHKWALNDEVWTRPCPAEPVPGKYRTERGLLHQRNHMENEDPSGKALVSCIIQQEVKAQWSGAAIPTERGVKIEGVAGFGDKYMDGTQAPDVLPVNIKIDVYNLYQSLSATFGTIKIEWAHDGDKVWLLQIHVVEEMPGGKTIYPGEFKEYLLFNSEQRLDHLRWLISNLPEGFGVVVQGNVGMSSHVADVLRKARVPSRLD